jgi:hypothetical protein
MRVPLDSVESEQMTPAGLPHLEVIRGTVGEPDGSATPGVRITRPGGEVLTVAATAEQVARVTGKAVTAMVVMGPSPRLIWIREEGAEISVPSPEQREEHLLREWSELLRRLAQ